MSKSNSIDEILIVVGISGVTCGGKTTTAEKLQKILPNAIVVSQDNYFLEENDPRHTWIPEINHVNYDIISSLDMEKMYVDISKLLENERVRRVNSQKVKDVPQDLNFIFNTLKTVKLRVLIIEGFCIFNYKPLLPFFDLKYYFTLTKEECLKRRELRIYDPPDCPGYFELCAWPEHLKQLDEVRTTVDDVNFCCGTEDITDNVRKDIFSLYSSM